MDKIVVETRPFTQTDREIELQEWAQSMMNEIDSNLVHGEETTDRKNILVVSDRLGNRAYRQAASVGEKDKKITYSHIIMPLKIVEDTKNNIPRVLTLPSGEEIEVPGETLLRFILTEELAHVYSKEKEMSLNEAYANLEGWKQIQNSEGGQKFITWEVSRLLVEANILGLAQIREYDGHKLPLKLEESTLRKINEELTEYFKNPEKARKEFMEIKRGEALVMADNLDEYPKGFVKVFV